MRIQREQNRATYPRDLVLIDEVGPIEYLGPELLDEIVVGHAEPYAHVEGDQDDVIVFVDSYGHRFVFKLTEFDPLRNAFRMELTSS